MPEFPAKAFGLEPEEAVKHMEAKGFKITWDWRKQIPLNNAQVFTVARAMRMDILMDIREMVDASVKQGITFRDFQKKLKPKLQAKGWWGYKVVEGKKIRLGSAHRLKTIYDTNMMSGYNAGRWREFELNRDNQPYLRYVALIDASTTAICRSLNGQIHAVGSEYWDAYAPPNHYRCRSRLRPYTKKQKDRAGGISKRPDIKPMEGFNTNPGKVGWQPKQSDYDPDIWAAGEKLKK